MYVRKKKNRSGSTSVVIVDKSSGKIRYPATIGVSSDEDTLSELCAQGKKWIAAHTGEQDIFSQDDQQREEKQVAVALIKKGLTCKIQRKVVVLQETVTNVFIGQ